MGPIYNHIYDLSCLLDGSITEILGCSKTNKEYFDNYKGRIRPTMLALASHGMSANNGASK